MMLGTFSISAINQQGLSAVISILIAIPLASIAHSRLENSRYAVYEYSLRRPTHFEEAKGIGIGMILLPFLLITSIGIALVYIPNPVTQTLVSTINELQGSQQAPTTAPIRIPTKLMDPQEKILEFDPSIEEEETELEESVQMISDENTNILYTGVLITKPNQIIVGGPMVLRGENFSVHSKVTVTFQGNYIGNSQTDQNGEFRKVFLMVEPILKGVHDIIAVDSNGIIGKTSMVIHASRPENRTAPKIVSDIPLVVKNIFTEDFFPPISNITIVGNYNNKTNWYYGDPPRIQFNATDDISGIKHIQVWYQGRDAQNCTRGVCNLQWLFQYYQKNHFSFLVS